MVDWDEVIKLAQWAKRCRETFNFSENDKVQKMALDHEFDAVDSIHKMLQGEIDEQTK